MHNNSQKNRLHENLDFTPLWAIPYCFTKSTITLLVFRLNVAVSTPFNTPPVSVRGPVK